MGWLKALGIGFIPLIPFLSQSDLFLLNLIHASPSKPRIAAELVASALAMKEAVFCSNMLTELGFGKEFEQVPPHIDNTATLHVIGNGAFSSRTKHIALRFFYIRELVKQNKLTTHIISTERQLADIETKHLNKHRLQQLLQMIKSF